MRYNPPLWKNNSSTIGGDPLLFSKNSIFKIEQRFYSASPVIQACRSGKLK